MLRNADPHRLLFVSRVRLFLERRHIRRRRRQRRAEEVLENPLSAHNRRRAMRERRDGQHAALAEQPAAAIVAALDAAEVRAANVRNAVVLREPLVDERVIGRQQIEHAAIFAQDAAREQLRFAAEAPGADLRRSRSRAWDPEEWSADFSETATARRSS